MIKRITRDLGTKPLNLPNKVNGGRSITFSKCHLMENIKAVKFNSKIMKT